jgi:class 3 adenylate cyclase/predicted negative regulator of RcsB-dependent stress response
MSQVAEPLEAGREAAARRSFEEAYELLSSVDRERPLEPQDLELLAESAMWSGRFEASIPAYERAYAAYLGRGEPVRAARVAIALVFEHRSRAAKSLAAGWHARAVRLLEGQPESAEHGYLALQDASAALFAGELDAAIEKAARAVEIASRSGDRDLQALAILRQGQTRVRKGELDQGLLLLDEATAAAVGGELTPLATGTIYCATIDACRDLGDYSRAQEWTDTATRWCERESIAGFPGVCRVDRAAILRFRGELETAEKEALRACQELGELNPRTAAVGYAEVGEVRLRRGDLAAAREAFQRADELGLEPQPGLALLRLAEGKAGRAAREIRHALDEESNPLARARLLPAAVEIELRAGDPERAAAAAHELEQVAETYGTKTLQAHATTARGSVHLSADDADAAVSCLRRARRLWQEVGAPYDEARTRLLLGLAYRAAGDEDGAVTELRAARQTFARLGAVLDAQRASELLGEASARRTFLFSDIVASTRTAEFLGPEKWKKVLAWHDRTLGELIRSNGGEVIKSTGDGFFAAFEAPGPALEAAVAIQRALRDHESFAPDVRIGIHAGTAFSTEQGDYGGEGVHAAARIGALAGGEEILVSRETMAGGAGFPLRDPRQVELTGLSQPVEVVSVDWR